MSSTPSDSELYATRAQLGALISESFKTEQDADPDATDVRLVDVVERVLSGIDPADYAEFLRVALIDSVDSYFNPQPLGGVDLSGLTEFLSQLGGDN